MREVKQHRYLQSPWLFFYMPRYTHSPCLTQCQSFFLMALLCMLAHVQRHPRVASVNKIKYKDHNQYEITSFFKEITTTHKLCYQPLFSFSSCLMCWMGSILFYFLQQNNWKLIFNVKLINYMHIIENFNDYIHLKHVVVVMVPPTM